MTEQTMNRIFTEGDDSSNLLVSWWEALDKNRGDRANIRRATSPAEVVFNGSFHGLLAKLRATGYPLSGMDADRIAAVAGLVAHVENHVSNDSVARQMATPKSTGGGARVSGLRFRRLLAVSDRDALYPLLIRVVRLLDGNVNLVSLANAIYWWNDRTKKQWAYEYYATTPSER